MALGDHDHRGNVTAQVEYSQRSPIWRMPAPYFVEHIHHGRGLTVDLIVTDSIGLEVINCVILLLYPSFLDPFYKII